MIELTRAAREVGLSLTIEVNAQQQSAAFIYMDDREVVSRHSTVFDAARWLDGYLRGSHRERSRDRSVC